MHRLALPVVLAAGLSALCPLATPSVYGEEPSAVRPLRQAHAHNDYEHDRPLLDALDHGFCSVEADIYLVDGQLLVAHNRPDVRPERTLEALYLDPLAERVGKNGGSVHPDGPPFTLLIDLKSDGPTTYAALHKTLSRYADMLTRVEDGEISPGAVTVVVSGNRPFADAAAQSLRYAGMDGRISDLESDAPAHLMPMISDRWGAHFRWRGDGPMPADEAAQLKRFVDTAHERGRTVRFWATPENEDVWGVLADAGVDVINTDDLPGLQRYLTERASQR